MIINVSKRCLKVTKKFDVISIGAVLVDMIAMVDTFPKKDGESFVNDFKMMPGGAAANVAVIGSRLEMESAFVGKIGQDHFGRILLEDLKNEGVHTTKTVSISKEFSTGSCYICVDKQGERMILAHSGAANMLTYEDLPIELLTKANWVHLSDLKNFSAIEQFLEEYSVRFSISPGALIAQHPKKALRLLEKADLIIGSLEEIMNILNCTEKSIEEEILKLVKKQKQKIVVVTKGKQGAAIYREEEKITIPIFKVPVVDTTGAGDAFTAGMLYALNKGKKPSEAGKIAAACSAICIQEIGARSGPKNEKELFTFLKKHN